ncbi:MAG: GAF domain-containing protein [Acidobacteriota bacterium]
MSDRSRAVIPRVQALGNLAECLCRMGRIKEARKALDRAEQAAEESGNPAIDHALNAIKAEVNLSEHDYAGTYRILSEMNDGSETSRALYTVGQAHYLSASLHFLLGNLEASVDSINMLRGVESSEAPFYEHELGEALHARIMHLQGKSAQAVKRLQALDKEVAVKRWPYHQYAMKLHLAEILIDMERFDEANRCVRDAIRLARAMRSEHMTCYSRLLDGLLHSRKWRLPPPERRMVLGAISGLSEPGTLQRAVEALEEAAKLADLSGHREIAWRAHAELATVYDRLHNQDAVLFHARVAYESMCKLENMVPGEMLAAYREGFCRKRIKKELTGLIESTHSGTLSEGSVTSIGSGLEHSQILLRVSATVNTIGDLDPLLEAVLDQLIGALGMERAAVYLREERTGKWTMAKGRSCSGGSVNVRLSQQILEEVGNRGNPVVSADVKTDVRFDPERGGMRGGSGRLLSAPLKISGKIIGLLYTDHSTRVESLEESVINLFAAFCNLSAIAI